MNVVETSESDVLVINTTAPTRVVEEPILPLPILSDGHPKLAERMEEFDLSQVMNPEIQKFIKQLKLTMTTYGGPSVNQKKCEKAACHTLVCISMFLGIKKLLLNISTT
jgi:hypothetical protein